jgi:hypothetical protein
MAHKTIVWKSWNATVDEIIGSIEEEMEAIQNELNNINEEGGIDGNGQNWLMPMFDKQALNLIHTPWGPYPLDSTFKPSDRWDCRIGTTNFDITHNVKDILNTTEGVEALKIMGRYTFAIGIPCTFNFREVRIEIEKSLCVYTEEEVLTEETQATVDMVKEQLKTKKYWSILVAPTGKVDYVVSDKLDQKYLEGLNELVEMKQLLGGIILRGDNG